MGELRHLKVQFVCPAGELGHTVTESAGGMGYEQAESCTTHNLMRLASKLFCASGGEMRYADYIEKVSCPVCTLGLVQVSCLT